MPLKQNRAFSLIEVLIAIAIVALGASLVVPVVQGNRDKAAYKVSVMNLKQVGKAMEKHYLEKGVYPVFQSWQEVSAENSPLLEYMNEIPAADAFGRDYKIERSDEAGYEFRGYSVEKNPEDYPDYWLVPGPKIKNKKTTQEGGEGEGEPAAEGEAGDAEPAAEEPAAEPASEPSSEGQ